MSIQLELMNLASDKRLTEFERNVCSDAALIIAAVTKLVVTSTTCEQDIHRQKEEARARKNPPA